MNWMVSADLPTPGKDKVRNSKQNKRMGVSLMCSVMLCLVLVLLLLLLQ